MCTYYTNTQTYIILKINIVNTYYVYFSMRFEIKIVNTRKIYNAIFPIFIFYIVLLQNLSDDEDLKNRIPIKEDDEAAFFAALKDGIVLW